MLSINKISFGHKYSNKILSEIEFSINMGEYVAILGESGCGKSTLLEIIYGLMDLEEGEIFYNNEKLLGPKFHLIPGHPFMKYLAQDFSLMPYTTVAENIGEFLSNRDKVKKQKRIDELLEVVDMTPFKNKKVKLLSGGQKQRVAIARVLAKEPEILLLDEPFSHIDNFRKNTLRRKLFSYLKSKNISCIVATHDSTDALSFADSIYIIKDTKIVGQGTPEELYNNPPSKYVASFFNEVNTIDDKLFYPEEIKIVDSSNNKATVLQSYFKGSHYLIETLYKGSIVLIHHTKSLDINTEVFIEF